MASLRSPYVVGYVATGSTKSDGSAWCWNAETLTLAAAWLGNPSAA